MKKAVCIMLLSFMLAGCSTSQGILKKVSLDMTKEQVIDKIGSPKAVREAIKDKSGQTIEIWEYDLSTRQAGEFYQDIVLTIGTAGIAAPMAISRSKDQVQSYWFYFYNSKLVQWGQAGAQPGDWKVVEKKSAE